MILNIEVSGLPNGIFNLWVRWNNWPGPGQEFLRRRRRRRPTYLLPTYLPTTYIYIYLINI